MELITYLSLIGVVILGGSIVVLLKNNIASGLKYILAFSGAFLLAISVMHIIPEVYRSSIPTIGVYVLIGFLIQLFLEFFSQGIEHGHIHVHKNAKNAFPVVIMLSLCIHSLLEGIPLVREINESLHGHEAAHSHSDYSLLLGILLHKFPISIALMSMFLKSELKLRSAFSWLLLFALMAPLGTFLGNILKEDIHSFTYFFDAILAVTLGMFLHISTTILFESDESHKFNFLKLLVIISGGVLAYFAS